MYGENANDVLSRLEAVGVDISMLPQNLRIIVPAEKQQIDSDVIASTEEEEENKAETGSRSTPELFSDDTR